MKSRKADLSMNMIIVAAIAIIVLLVVVMMFSGKMRNFGTTMQSCEAQGGECSANSVPSECFLPGASCLKDHCPANSVVLKGTDCEQPETSQRVCCKTII